MAFICKATCETQALETFKIDGLRIGLPDVFAAAVIGEGGNERGAAQTISIIRKNGAASATKLVDVSVKHTPDTDNDPGTAAYDRPVFKIAPFGVTHCYVKGAAGASPFTKIASAAPFELFIQPAKIVVLTQSPIENFETITFDDVADSQLTLNNFESFVKKLLAHHPDNENVCYFMASEAPSAWSIFRNFWFWTAAVIIAGLSVFILVYLWMMPDPGIADAKL